MKQLVKLITKYSILLALSSFFGVTWFYLKSIVMPIENIEDIGFWHNLPSYSGYFFKILISFLLFLDVKKFNLNFYVIPIVGLFYPLLGVCTLLIMIIYTENKTSSAQQII